MKAQLIRLYQTPIGKEPQQTEGILYVLDGNKTVFSCKTLELPWRDNQRRISCVPDGTYKVVRRSSAKYKNHFHLLDVPNRSLILIHQGNYNHQTMGCILVGKEFRDINKNGLMDVTSSVATMNELLKYDIDEINIKWR
jgi:hypothetical protein